LFASPLYGGPQLSRQKNYCNLTTKKNLTAKRRRLTAKRITSRQKEKPHGKKKKTHGKISSMPRGHFNSFFFSMRSWLLFLLSSHRIRGLARSENAGHYCILSMSDK